MKQCKPTWIPTLVLLLCAMDRPRTANSSPLILMTNRMLTTCTVRKDRFVNATPGHRTYHCRLFHKTRWRWLLRLYLTGSRYYSPPLTAGIESKVSVLIAEVVHNTEFSLQQQSKGETEIPVFCNHIVKH